MSLPYHRNFLIFLIELIIWSQFRAAMGSDKCDGLSEKEAKRCCTLADSNIALNSGRMMYDMLETSGPGDVIYVKVAQECIQKKKELKAGSCAKVKYNHNTQQCLYPPFSHERLLIQDGMLHLPDRISLQSTAEECRNERYLLWTRNGADFVAGHRHKTYSLACALWEANSLNRTLVVDSFVSINKIHTGLKQLVDVPFGAWYDVNLIRALPSGGMFWHEFFERCGAPGVLTEAKGEIVIMPSGATHEDMVLQADVPLLVRGWGMRLLPSLKYGFRVCHQPEATRDKDVDFEIPDAFRWPKYAQWVDNVTDVIMIALNETYDDQKYDAPVCVHVRRGDKVTKMKKTYPNLDFETSPQNILNILELYHKPGSSVYIATNEPNASKFFAPLENTYRVLTLNSFSEFIDPSSFLSSTLGLVDYTILSRCERMIPTFRSEESKGFDHQISLSQSEK